MLAFVGLAKHLSRANPEVDLRVFSRKGKLGGNDMFIGGRGGRHSPTISEIRRKSAMLEEKWPRFIL